MSASQWCSLYFDGPTGAGLVAITELLQPITLDIVGADSNPVSQTAHPSGLLSIQTSA